MSLIDWIEKLQKKPRWVRIQIMWLGVTLCMIVVILFWLWSLSNLSSVPSKTTQSSESELWGALGQIKKDIPTLWQSLGAGISDIFKSVKEEIAEPSKSPKTEKPSEEKLPIE